ncbi:efflux transporter outer membrane subunit [Candidatus Sumerlaeota bacterium]|nr:efflux transporter outer membrane subunit [Candidatus Sumerlaeota bacterium]
MVRIQKLSMIAAVALLSGCVVGPDYKVPENTLSNAWVTPTDKWTISTIPQEKQWWRNFNDSKLNELVARAYEGNLDLKIAEARVRQAREARIVASAPLLPVIGASGSATRRRNSEDVVSKQRKPKVKPAGAPDVHNLGGPPVFDAHGHPVGAPSTLVVTRNPTVQSRGVDPYSNLFEAGFDAQWELDFFGGTRRAREAAKADLEEAQENQRDVLIILLSEVARNYVELRGQQRQLAVSRENSKSQRSTLDLTGTRMRAGLATDLDVARAEAQLATTEASIPTFEASVEGAIYRLGVLVGEEPGALQKELVEPVPIPAVPVNVEFSAPADLVRRRPDVRAAERALAAETARIGVAKSDLYPKFMLNGSLGLATSDIDKVSTGSSRQFSFGPSVSIPLFNAGELRARVRAQRARADEALANYKNVVLGALEEADNALTALSRERVRRDALARAVESNRRAVRLSNDLYKQGLIDFLSVLDTQRELFQSESLLANSETRVSTNLVAAYKAMGGGWEVFLPPSAEDDAVAKDAPAPGESDKGDPVPATTPVEAPSPATP